MSTTASPNEISRAITGAAFSVMMMTLFGTAWLAWGLHSMQADSPWLIAALVLPAIALLVPGFGMFQLGRRATKRAAPLTADQKRAQRQMGRTYGIVVGAEGLLIFLAVNVLTNLHLDPYIMTAVAAIVGLHFLPLARLFRVPLYYWVGGVIVADALLSLALSSPTREIAVGLSMGAILWLTCVLVLRQGFQLAHHQQTAHARGPGSRPGAPTSTSPFSSTNLVPDARKARAVPQATIHT